MKVLVERSRSSRNVLLTSNLSKLEEKVTNVEFIESDKLEENTKISEISSVLNYHDDYFFMGLDDNDSDTVTTDSESIVTNDSISLSCLQYEQEEDTKEYLTVLNQYDDYNNTKWKCRSFESINGNFETISLAVTGVRVVKDENDHEFAQFRIQGYFKGFPIDLWRRYTSFCDLATIANRNNMSNTILQWDALQCFKHIWRNLDMEYLLGKKVILDQFLETYLYECDTTSSFTEFLNIKLVNNAIIPREEESPIFF